MSPAGLRGSPALAGPSPLRAPTSGRADPSASPSGAASGTDGVVHPDVRLPVVSGIRVEIDLECRQSPGEPEVAALGERHVRPALPLGDRAADPWRPGLVLENACTEAFVHP